MRSARSTPEPGANRLHDCIIVGGGISGLSAANRLGPHGDVLVLEAGERTGGRVLSGQWNGWSYAKGAGYLGRPEGGFARMVDDLGLAPIEIPAPLDVYLRDGRSWAGDRGRARLLVEKGGVSPFNRLLLALYEISESYEWAPDHDPRGVLGRYDRMSCFDWFRELRLPPIYFDVFNVASRGLFGVSLKEVSALGAFEELAFDFAGMKPLGQASDLESGNSLDAPSGAYTFPGGISSVTSALTRRLGERCLTSTPVDKIDRWGRDGFAITSTGVDGARRQFRSRSVIVAVPAPIAVRIAGPVLKTEQAALLTEIRFSDYAMVTVFSDEPLIEKGFDVAVADGLIFTDIYDRTWVERRTGAGNSGRTGYVTAFTVAAPIARRGAILDMSDDALVAACLKDFVRIEPGWKGAITGHDVHRFRHAYPIMGIGAYERLARLHDTLSGTIQMAGDGMIYPTVEGAVDAGFLAADRILHRL